MRLYVSLFVVSLASLSFGQKCADINPGACQLLVDSQPGYCSDTTARTTCPKFCKLCPVECYHCNATVLDYHDCNTTVLCPEGQLCMRKELRSTVDGHHEYQMTCETKQTCDGGQGFTVPFGKRDVESRDLSVTCCADDLCNYPGNLPSTTTGCSKDIIFMVDEASTIVQKDYSAIKSAIESLAHQIQIGSNDNLVSVYGFDSSVNTKFLLNENLNAGDLATTAQLLHFHTASLFSRGDTTEAVEFLVNHATSAKFGDRPGYPDVIVFISDTVTSQTFHLSALERMKLQQISQDVISVTVGTTSSWSIPIDHLATDRNHQLHVNNISDPQVFLNQILPLITAC